METIIGYIYKSEKTELDTFHCIDCTNININTKKYLENCNKLDTLTDDYIYYLRSFTNQFKIKAIVCGTCDKVIANENTINK